MDWYDQSNLNTENNLKTDFFNIPNNLPIHEGEIPTQINMLSNVTICENLFDKTLPSFSNEVERTDKTNLCMYCGIFVVNLNEHITIHGEEKIIGELMNIYLYILLLINVFSKKYYIHIYILFFYL